MLTYSVFVYRYDCGHTIFCLVRWFHAIHIFGLVYPNLKYEDYLINLKCIGLLSDLGTK